MSSNGNTRVRSMKKGITAEEARRKREDRSVSIRKNKRKQHLLKRRNMSATPKSVGTAPGPAGPTSIGDLPSIARVILTCTPEKRFQLTQTIRKFLSKEEEPPVQPIINAGLVPRLVQLLKFIKEPKTQFEAAWALTNIASTEYTRVIVESGASDYLIKLMKSNSAEVREQCLWCLGNVAGDGTHMRDMLLNNPDAIRNLLLNITRAANVSMLKNATWTLSNFCRGKPQPELSKIKAALPILAKLITHSNQEVVGDACWALSYVSDGADDRIQSVVDVGVMPTLVSLLRRAGSSVTPALRSAGNIVSGNERQTQAAIDAGIIPALGTLLDHGKQNIRKEACWTLSNIAAGTPAQVASLLACPSIVQKVMQLLGSDNFQVQKEAVWVIANLCTAGCAVHIDKVVQLGGIAALVRVLDMNGENDVKVINVALDALKSILASSQASGRGYDQQVEELEGLDYLEALQSHENEEIYQKVVHIITTYLDGDDDDNENENENVAPDGQSFSFGAVSSKKCVPVNDDFGFGSSANNDFGFGGSSENTMDNDFGFGFDSGVQV